MARDEQAWAKCIGVNGIEPSKSTISNNTYPYVCQRYTRQCAPTLINHPTRISCLNILIMASGQKVVKESGYVPINNQR